MRSSTLLKTLLLATLVYAAPPLIGKTVSSEEHFFLKKIAEFCKDQDYRLTKAEILQFLKDHPDTNIKDSLYAALGDLYFHENLFLEAIGCYQAITTPSLVEKTLYKHAHSLYELKNLQGIITLATPFFDSSKKGQIDFRDDVQFLLATSLFQKWKECSEPQEKHALAEQAKKLYQTLSLNTHKELAISPLAELHRTLLEYPQAASLYLLLAEKKPKDAEDLFLVAASLQLSFDKTSAMDSYQRAYLLKGPKAPIAAYNRLTLLFQEKKYAALINGSEELASHLNEENQKLLQFCVGYSHFQQENFLKAKEALEKYAFLPDALLTYKQQALELLLVCAQREEEEELFEKSVKEMVVAFPHSEKTASALLLHADFAKARGNLGGAIATLKNLETLFPEFPEMEKIAYQKALFLSEKKEWEESRLAFKQFVEKFPQDSKADLAWGHILHSFMEELKSTPLENRKALEIAFAKDLEIALGHPTFFAPDEKEEYQYLLSKTFFELKNYPQAIQAADKLESSQFKLKKHLLCALSYRELPAQEGNFIFHAEKTLELDPLSSQATAFELELFNTYVATEQWDKAASQLYTYAIEKEHPVKSENLLWLANYYYKRRKEESSYTARASFLFQKALGIQETEESHTLASLTSAQEVEVLKWAELLQKEKQVKLLSSLINEQKKRPEAGWKLQRQALFTLANFYAREKESDKALILYDQLIEKSPLTVSYFSSAALLEKCRLILASCPLEAQETENPKITQVLGFLKELQMQKQLYFEPIHLEAALEYASLRASLAPEKDRQETTLFFLKRLQEDFLSVSDPAQEEYHRLKNALPEKKALFDNYLNFVQAEILSLEGKKEEAQEILEKLQRENNLTPFLLERVQNHLKALL